MNITFATRLPSSICPELTKAQTQILEAEFLINVQPDIYTRDRLAHLLQLSNLHIHVWFQTHRSKLRNRPGQQSACQTGTNEFTGQSSMSIQDRPTRKRKSPCDLHDNDGTSPGNSPPWKKSATIPPPMSYHCLPPCPLMTAPPTGFGAFQHHASRDIPNGANHHVQKRAPSDTLMSVDFLSSSSSSSTTKPSFNAVSLHPSGIPIFYPPTVDFQRTT
nr:paired mesoderm homeobox protein 2A-like [Lytechinus pictus]